MHLLQEPLPQNNIPAAIPVFKHYMILSQKQSFEKDFLWWDLMWIKTAGIRQNYLIFHKGIFPAGKIPTDKTRRICL
jgi:hypothetical protein